MKQPTSIVAAVLAAFTAGGAAAEPNDGIRNLQPFADPTGAVATFNVHGAIDTRGAFFQSLGTNGRSCASCHQADEAFSISPPQIRARFRDSRGADPLFAAVDGANCPDAAAGDPAGHSLLLRHGLIRVALPIPENAQFTLTVVHDPFGCALVTDPRSGRLTASVYRRPLPTTNLRFLSAIMFDGRQTKAPLTGVATFAANLQADLTGQAADAIAIHFQANAPASDAQLADIVNFELGLSTAQVWDRRAGDLDRAGASGGPRRLGTQVYYPGINDVLGADPTGAAFDSSGMTLFAPWATAGYVAEDADDNGHDGHRYADLAAVRRDIAAGEILFNTLPINITAVRGLNDNAALGRPAVLKGTCTTCHDTPNVGDHSLPLPLDIGVAHTPLPGFENDPGIAKGLAELDAPNLPVFLVSGCPAPFGSGQAASFYTTDPGKGLITGLCGDLNRMKGPVLRGLAARAPYFHNGAAASLNQAVNFYDQRFAMHLTEEQKRQLVAFLNSL